MRNKHRFHSSLCLAAVLVSNLARPSLLAAQTLSASRPPLSGQNDTAPIVGSIPVKCVAATSDSKNTSDRPACLFILSGGAMTLMPGQTAGVIGPGSITLKCVGGGDHLTCQASLGKEHPQARKED